MTKPTLLVLAAGMGSRYGGSKQVDPIGPNEEIILDYSIYDAWRAGFGKVVFVIQEQMEPMFRELFEDKLAGKMDIAFAHQKLDDLPDGFTLPEGRQKPWGTGHAIWAARDVINENFAVINADDFYGTDSFSSLGKCLLEGEPTQDPNTFCMVAFKLANTLSKNGSVSRGACTVNDAGYLSDVVELTKIECTADGARYLQDSGEWKDISTATPVSMNMWGFSGKVMKTLDSEFVAFLKESIDVPKSEFFIPFVVDAMVKRGECKTLVLYSDEQWFGMTYKEDKEEVVANVAKLISQNVYPENLWA